MNPSITQSESKAELTSVNSQMTGNKDKEKETSMFKCVFMAEIKCPKCGKICRGLAKGRTDEYVFESDAVKPAVKKWNEEEHLH